MIIKAKKLFQKINWQKTGLTIALVGIMFISSLQFFLNNEQTKKLNAKIDQLTNEIATVQRNINFLDSSISDAISSVEDTQYQISGIGSTLEDVKSDIGDVNSAIEYLLGM